MSFFISSPGTSARFFDGAPDTNGLSILDPGAKEVTKIDLQVSNTTTGAISIQGIAKGVCEINIYYSNWADPISDDHDFANCNPYGIEKGKNILAFKAGEAFVPTPNEKFHKVISVPICRYVWIEVVNTDAGKNPIVIHALFV
jgi:hypothetical protein